MTQSHSIPPPRCADGRRWWTQTRAHNMEGNYHAYSIAIEPLLREIRTAAGRVVSHITRNRYDAEVLNTNQMLIVDVDIQDDHGRCPSARLYQAVLAHARAGKRLDVEELIRVQLEAGRQAWEDPAPLEDSWRLYQDQERLPPPPDGRALGARALAGAAAPAGDVLLQSDR